MTSPVELAALGIQSSPPVCSPPLCAPPPLVGRRIVAVRGVEGSARVALDLDDGTTIMLDPLEAGEVVVGDLRGLAVHIAARITALAHRRFSSQARSRIRSSTPVPSSQSEAPKP